MDTLLSEFDYDLLADGRRSGVTEKDAQGNQTRIDWLYDAAGRLTREVYDSYNNSLDFAADYVLDLVGNRQAKKTDSQPLAASFTDYRAGLAMPSGNVDESIAYTYDANDRLLTETKDAVGTSNDRYTAYAYGTGNAATQLTGKTIRLGLNSGGTLLEQDTYAYDLQGRMSQVLIDANGNGVAEKKLDYRYDDNGIRVSQVETNDTNGNGLFTDEMSTPTTYLNDANNPTGYSQVLEETNPAMMLGKRYTLGLDVISQTPYMGGVQFFLYDGHGSTRGLVDATGQPLSGQVYRYDAFGMPIGFDAATASTTILYSGEWLDKFTGLQYLRARYLDPATGRFTTLDPFAGSPQDPQSLHKYAYCGVDAVNHSDPTGLMTMGECMVNVQTILNTAVNWMNTGMRIYQTIQRLNGIIGMLSFFRDLPGLFPRMRAEIERTIAEAGVGQLARMATEDILNTFRQVLTDAISIAATSMLATIAGLHLRRIEQAFASAGARHHHLVIYLPTLGGLPFRRDRWLVQIPGLELLDFPVSISFGGRGGRLWGIGLALPKRERNPNEASYQLLRVDWHAVAIRDNLHQPPYARFFQRDNDHHHILFHWQIPNSANEARSGLAHE